MHNTASDLKERMHGAEIRIKYTEDNLHKVDEKLNTLDTALKELVKSINELSNQICLYEGAKSAKQYLWIFILTLFSTVGALGLHNFIFKFFGIDV